MKRLLSIIVLVITLVFYSVLFTACNTTEEEVDNTPKFSEKYSFNENLHWRDQINGTERTDVGEHVNNSGKCESCDYYFDPSEYLTFVKVFHEDQEYYVLYEFKGSVPGAYTHIEIPLYHKGEDDEYPIPVLGVNAYAFAPGKHPGIEKIKSVKINDGIKHIGSGAFSGSSISEVVIPNSVIGGMDTVSNVQFDEEGKQIGYAKLNNMTRGLYSTFSGCISLKRAVVGNGVTAMVGYVFSKCSVLEEVYIGNSLTRFATRDFYCCPALDILVIPDTLELVRESHIWSNAVNKYVSLYNIFEGSNSYPDIFTYMTKETYKSRIVRQVPRDMLNGFPYDENGNTVDISQYSYSYPYGLVEGWCGLADIYYLGEWSFDENGKPRPY